MGEGESVLLGVIVGAVVTGAINFLLQRQQFRHTKDMFFLQNKSGEAVKDILENMLNHRSHIRRSFAALKKPIGGFTDDEIRQFLHELEATKTTASDGREMWYLLSRKDEFRQRRCES